MGEPTGSWSILPKPLGVWPRFRFSLRVSLGKISSSCISSAIRAASWSTVKKAERRGARPVKAARPAFAAAGWWIANLACELFGVIYPHPISVCTMRTSRAHRVMQCAICLPRFSQEWRGRPMELTRGTSSMATRCAGAIYRLARSGKTRDGNADMPGGVRVIVSLLTAPLRWRYGYVRGKTHAARVDRLA